MSNKAAWIKAAKANPLVVDDAPLAKPGQDQVLIKNSAFAINPVDWKIQDYDLFFKKYPAILGEDIAGEIIEVGEGVTRFQKGDRVIAHCIGLATQKPEHGAFQLYTVAFASLVSKLPESVSFEEGVVLPLAISTAAAGLYMKDLLNLPLPTKNAGASGKSILVYGASSSVGAIAVQLAVASGFNVITTASSQHHELAKSLGATEVFDYKDPDVVAKLVGALKAAGELVGVYDAIGLPPTLKICAAVLEKYGGGFIASTLPAGADEQLPASVKVVSCYAPAIHLQEPEIAKAVWGKYIPEALADGSFKCKPDPLVVGTGLESIQAGFNRQKQGVSGQKVVVTL